MFVYIFVNIGCLKKCVWFQLQYSLYGDWTLTHRPTLNLEGQVLQFVWPFTWDLPSMVEPLKDWDPNWYSLQDDQSTQNTSPY